MTPAEERVHEVSLSHVRVLVLVQEHGAEPRAVIGDDLRIPLRDLDRAVDLVAEVDHTQFALELPVPRTGFSELQPLFRSLVHPVGSCVLDDEPFASVVDEPALATEWEWERSPELTLVVTPDVADAIALCNRYSPRFVTSVITTDPAEFERCYEALDTPFTGNGFTRWVDGQSALDRPELGLANWQGGRLLGRGAILSGDSVFTVRYVARVDDTGVHR